MIKILELFSGNADITNYLNNNYVGLRCYSVDYEKKYNADYCLNYSKFLDRCKIPQKLLENICNVIVDLINDEYHVQGNTLEKA